MMKRVGEFVVSTVVAGLVILAPIYFAMLLLFRAMQSFETLLRPIAELLPAWFPAEHVLSLLLVLIVCFLIGVAMRTSIGRAAREQIETSLLDRIPGYSLFRGLTQQLAGARQQTAWKPALVEIEEALVPAFIIEQLDDGRFTVFVPSVPTPFAGSVYILSRERVHPLNVSFTQAIQTVSRWGSGATDLAAAMKQVAR